VSTFGHKDVTRLSWLVVPDGEKLQTPPQWLCTPVFAKKAKEHGRKDPVQEARARTWRVAVLFPLERGAFLTRTASSNGMNCGLNTL
jgi:hypothetical protein